MNFRAKLSRSAALLLAATALTTTAHAQDPKSFMDPGKDWPTFHGSYKSWNYSPLTQINTENVGKLKVAFIEQVGRSTRGLETTPLAKDGILYYSGSYSKVFAVKGDTGEILWSYVPKLDEDTVARQTHSPYNRGMAMDDKNLYVGTVDGRLIAIDRNTGKPVWDTKLINSQKLTVRIHWRTAFGQGQDHHWLPRRRVALPGSDLRCRRKKRQQSLGVLDRRGHAGG